MAYNQEEIDNMMRQAIPQICGWIPAPDDVAWTLSRMLNPRFQDAAPHLMETWDKKSNIRLWDATLKVNGRHLKANSQGIGDCISHSFGRGCDYLQCNQIVTGRDDYEYIDGISECMTEVLYGAAREEGKYLNNRDGAAGIWAINALRKYGYIPRNGKPYDASLAKQYGLKGIPAEYKVQGQVHLLEDFAAIKTLDELDNALYHRYSVPICSNQGFKLVRNPYGICAPEGTWGHCLLICGLLLINGKKNYTILQSWGEKMPSGPLIENMPPNSFNGEDEVVEGMIRSGEAYALAAEKGFPSHPFNAIV
jgi:hypothetical protein